MTDGNSGNNYTYTFVSVSTGVITARGLTVTGITANNKTYTGTTAATLNTGVAALVGVVPPDAVTLDTGAATGNFANANVANNIVVTVAGLTISGGGAANYSLTQPTTTANITQAAPTVSVTGGTFTFDGSTQPATGFGFGVGGVSDVLTPAVTFSYVGVSGTTYGPTATAPTNAGSYQVTASFAGNTNYTSAANTGSLTINKAAPVFDQITASQTIVYGTASIGLAGRIRGGGDRAANPDSLTITIDGVPPAAVTFNGGSGTFGVFTFDTHLIPASAVPYTITYTYGGSANIAAGTDTTTTLTVNKAAPVFSNLSVNQTITYGTPSIAVSGKIAAGTVFPPTSESIGITVDGASGSAAIGANGLFSTSIDTHLIAAAATPYAITYTYAADPNFNGATSNATSLTVNKATPTVSVTGGTFTYDGSSHGATGFAYGVGGTGDVQSPAVTFSYAGTGATIYGPSAAAPSNVGTYRVTASFGGNSNYSSASNTATITITQATPTVSVTGGSFTYNGSPHAASGLAYGVGGTGDVLGPAVTFSYVGTGTTTYGPTATAPTNAGTYQATASFAGNSNYTSASNAAALTIDKATASVTPDAKSKTFGDADPTLTGTLVGFVATDGIDGELRPDGRRERGDVSDQRDAESGGGARQLRHHVGHRDLYYQQSGSDRDGGGGTFTYDAAVHSASGSAKGVHGEDLAPVTVAYSLSPGPGSLTGAPTAAGAYQVAARYAGDSNYNQKQSAAQALTINKATASVTPDAKSKTYGDADPTLTGTLCGFLAADGVTASYSRTAGESVAGSPYTISATLSAGRRCSATTRSPTTRRPSRSHRTASGWRR